MTGIDYSDSTPDVSFSYDGDGNRMQMTDAAGTVSYSYDDLNRLTSVTRGSDTFSYGYDDASNLTSRTYPGGTATSYGYDNDERLASAGSGGASTSYGYDPAAQLIQTTRPGGNGWSESRSYDRAGQLTQIKDANATSTLQQLDYAYDPIGNAISLTRLSGAEYYQYDNRDRLTRVCYDAACASATDTIGWTYDGVGNRLTETRPAGTTSYTYDAADELTQTSGPGGTTGYSYDTSGNETAAGSRSYTYDLASRPVSTTSGSATTSYSYDGDGNRLSANTGSATTNYLWDTNNGLPQLALERNGSGSTLRSYIRGIDTIALNEGGNTYYYHHDRLGSVTALTSSAGATEWAYTYEPFGAPRTTSQPDPNAPISPLAYVGQYQDPTSSLLDLRARQYDQASGRFLGLDPEPAGPATPYESAYAYAGQDPINGYDLAGTNTTWPVQLISMGWGFGLLFAAVGGCAINPAACNSGSSIIIKKIHDWVQQARGSAGEPDPAADGNPHTTIRRGPDGKVDGYTTWDKPANSGDRAKLRPSKRYDGSGAGHFDKGSGKVIPTPHVHEGGRVRAPHKWEIPA